MKNKQLTSKVAVALVYLMGTIYFFSFESDYGEKGPQIIWDGVYYWYNLRSIIIDKDVNFSNEYREYGNPFKFPDEKNKRAENPFPIGTALLWTPLYLVAHGLVHLMNHFGAAIRTDGMSRLETELVLYMSYIFGFASFILTFRFCRRHFSHFIACIGTVGVALGGQIIFYMLWFASYSHATAAFLCSAFIERWDATREKRNIWGWIVLGGIGGLSMAVRPQFVVLSILPITDIIKGLVKKSKSNFKIEIGETDKRKEKIKQILKEMTSPLAGFLMALVAFFPQMIVWKINYGSFMTNPLPGDFMQWKSSLWMDTLFNPRAGLFPWMPIAVLCIIGLFVIAAKKRWLGIPMIMILIAATYINGAYWDWWAGYTYGARRFTFALPIFAIGLCAIVEYVLKKIKKHETNFSISVVAAIIALFCITNVFMMINKKFDNEDWYNNRSFYKVYSRSFDRALKFIDDIAGNPFSYPASFAFAIKNKTSPKHYDEVAAGYLLDDVYRYGEGTRFVKRKAELDLRTEYMKPFLVGEYDIEKCSDGQNALALKKSNLCILLPMVRKHNLKIVLAGMSLNNKEVIATFNERQIGKGVLIQYWNDVSFMVPDHYIIRGVNKLCIIHKSREQKMYKRMIGNTGIRSPVDIAIYSAGYKDGNSSEIWINGKEVGSQHRGLNVVILDKINGRIKSTHWFDTYKNNSASGLFADTINRIKTGDIVLVSVRDDASRKFNKNAKKAIENIGGREDLSDDYRCGYAIIGVKGASCGAAIERIGKGKSTEIILGKEPKEHVYKAFYTHLIMETIK